MPRKMTEEEWDKLGKQDEEWEVLPILKKDIYRYSDPDSGLKKLMVDIQYEKVRKDHVVEVLIPCYQVIPNKEIGDILEDAVHLILYRLKCIEEEPLASLPFKYIPELDTPSHCYKFIRHHEKDIEEVDFISNSIVIECKNWADYNITDSYINDQILPRFKNYSDPRYRKILITSASFSSPLENKISQNNIEIFKFSKQITWENFPEMLNELLPLIAKDILNLDMELPDVSCIWLT